MQREGFGIRVGAYLIDLIIMMVVIGGIVGLIFLGTFSVGFGTAGTTGAGTTPTVSAGTVRLVSILTPLLGLAYASLEIFAARSVGKMALGLIIRGENGDRAPTGQLMTRWAVKYSPTLIGLLFGLTGVMALSYLSSAASLVILVGCFLVVGQKRQAIHDMVAKTAVFKVNAVVAPGFQPIMPGSTTQPYTPPGNPQV